MMNDACDTKHCHAFDHDNLTWNLFLFWMRCFLFETIPSTFLFHPLFFRPRSRTIQNHGTPTLSRELSSWESQRSVGEERRVRDACGSLVCSFDPTSFSFRLYGGHGDELQTKRMRIGIQGVRCLLRSQVCVRGRLYRKLCGADGSKQEWMST